MEPKNPSEPSFAQRVEEALLQVPPGRVVTYGGLALLAGRPRAARAVGMLMARNPYGESIALSSGGVRLGRTVQPVFPAGTGRRLRAEGVEVVDFHVDLSRYGWDGRSRS